MCVGPIKSVMHVFFGMFLSHMGGKLQGFGWHEHKNIVKMELFLLVCGLILLWYTILL